MQKLTNSLKNLFLDILFPKICFGCEKQNETLCKECREKIKLNKRENSNLKIIPWVYSYLNYQNTILQKIFYALKYNHAKSLAKSLAILVKEDFILFLQKVLSETKSEYKNIVFIPIPISKKRFIERDYNQSEILIKEILELIKKEEGLDLKDNLILDILLKEVHTIKFAKTHSVDERKKLIKDAFYINNKYLNTLLDKNIFILFDDITTTGTTFYEARKTLLYFGIKKENIYAYALAH